ncbi:MAG TPA: Crp/Fnr family transcriptional regulator [Candidatus Saccharimonadales bacterium]|jgi:CRP-like cAMP-binding protein|nr:Crp/Fnr family transcriptional regulator [Candidatus Saccharimonadales bacterium]
MTSTIDVKNELYANLSDEVRQELAQHEQPLAVARGKSLVRCGAPSDQIIILNSGSAEITVPAGDKTLSLGIAGPGKVLALQPVLSGEPSHTNVTCLEDCEVKLLSKGAFLGVLQRNPQMYFAIVRILSTDLTAADDVIRGHGRVSKSKIHMAACHLR